MYAIRSYYDLDIGHHCVGSALLELLEGNEPGTGGTHIAVELLGEDHAQHVEHVRLIIDNQESPAGSLVFFLCFGHDPVLGFLAANS